MARFGADLSGTLGSHDAKFATRYIDVLELWSGCFSIGRAAIAQGFTAVPFDKNRIPGTTDVEGEHCEDLLTESGFKHAVSLVLQVRSNGMLAMGPTCATFGFPNSSRCKRSLDNPWGDETYDKVQVGNAECEVCRFFVLLGVARGLFVVLENPPRSWLFDLLEDTTNTYMVS